jgi:hypothetical protein
MMATHHTTQHSIVVETGRLVARRRQIKTSLLWNELPWTAEVHCMCTLKELDLSCKLKILRLLCLIALAYYMVHTTL